MRSIVAIFRGRGDRRPIVAPLTQRLLRCSSPRTIGAKADISWPSQPTVALDMSGPQTPTAPVFIP